eukprot:360142-Chlamydomonas_euryale.AAC.2
MQLPGLMHAKPPSLSPRHDPRMQPHAPGPRRLHHTCHGRFRHAQLIRQLCHKCDKDLHVLALVTARRHACCLASCAFLPATQCSLQSQLRNGAGRRALPRATQRRAVAASAATAVTAAAAAAAAAPTCDGGGGGGNRGGRGDQAAMAADSARRSAISRPAVPRSQPVTAPACCGAQG